MNACFNILPRTPAGTTAAAIALLLATGVLSNAEVSTNAPAHEESLRLRDSSLNISAAPRIAEILRRETLYLAPAPLAKKISLAHAQEAVLSEPAIWRNWAALARAHYESGEYDKAFAAAKQMNATAQSREENVSLEGAELYAKCKRAAEALSLLE